MNENLNPYTAPEKNPEKIEEINAEGLMSGGMINTNKIAIFSKAILGVYVFVFFFVAVWNFKLAYEYDKTDEWNGLFGVSYGDMQLIEEDGTLILFYSCALVVSVWVFRSMKNAWVIQRSGSLRFLQVGL